jgi:hypothetical protein
MHDVTRNDLCNSSGPPFAHFINAYGFHSVPGTRYTVLYTLKRLFRTYSILHTLNMVAFSSYLYWYEGIQHRRNA